jgi:hypothetical protein
MQVGYPVIFPANQRVFPPQDSIGPPQHAPPESVPRAEWSPWENALLLQAVARFGASDWTRIARTIGQGRTKAQCAQHWFRCLNPSIAKGRWSLQEDEKLLGLVDRFGPKNWVRISREMANRSDVQCRHRYMNIGKTRAEPRIERTPLPSIGTLLDGQPRAPLPTGES